MAGAQGTLAATSPIPQRGASIPPYLELRDDLLFWSFFDLRTEAAPANNEEAMARILSGRNPQQRVDGTGMLDAFIRIRDGSDVLLFARRYGVLDICEHGLPGSHNPNPIPLVLPAQEGCKAWGEEGYLYWEPVAIWLGFVAQMRAILSIAVDVRAGRLGRAEDWNIAYEQLRWNEEAVELGKPLLGKTLEFDRLALAERVSAWMNYGNVHPELQWHEATPIFSLAGRTFGTLGIQLLFATTRAQGIAICSGCGMPYPRKRKPREGGRNFCENCGERVAARLRKREYRARQEARNG